MKKLLPLLLLPALLSACSDDKSKPASQPEPNPLQQLKNDTEQKAQDSINNAMKAQQEQLNQADQAK